MAASEAARAPPPAGTRLSARTMWAGAAAPPVGAAGALVAAPMAAFAPAARAPPPASTRLSARLAMAAALILLGCAAAGLFFFSMILSPAAQGKPASEHLLLTATTPQALPGAAPAALAEPDLQDDLAPAPAPAVAGEAPGSAPLPRLEPQHPHMDVHPAPPGPPATRLPTFVPSSDHGAGAVLASSLLPVGLAMGLLL